MRSAAIVSVGEEILCGDIVDTNAAEIARALRAAGWTVRSSRCIGDDADAIAEALRAAAAQSVVVVMTGGLGPTRDDVTRDGLALASGSPLEEDAAALAAIQALFAKLGRPMSASNRLQALRPRGAVCIENPMGTAPGIEARVANARVFALPGVPVEMRRMLQDHVLPGIGGGGAALAARIRIHAHGLPESVVGERIAAFMGADKEPYVGVTVSGGILTVSVTARSESTPRAAVEAIAADIELRLGVHVFGRDGVTLEESAYAALHRRALRVAVAESCTGGLVVRLLARVPGVSDVLVEGAVTYANDAKTRRLGVAPELIAAHGAVSPEVAAAMARGAAHAARVPIAVSTTGVAGPGGGTPEKPVGRVEFGVFDRGRVVLRRAQIPGDRETIQLRAARIALDLIRRAAEGTLPDSDA